MNGVPNHLDTVYQEALTEKRHYDSLSWAIGGSVLVVSAAVLSFLPRISVQSYVLTVLLRIPVSLLTCFMVYAWLRIYRRNQFWAETANEAARDVERTWNARGVTISYSIARNNKCVVLKNLDESGGRICAEVPILLPDKELHHYVPIIVYAVICLLILACFLPRLPA